VPLRNYSLTLLSMEKTKPNTTKAHINKAKEMYYNTKLGTERVQACTR